NIYRVIFFFSSRRRHTRFSRDWSSDVCSSDLVWGLSATLGNLDEAMQVLLGEDAAPGVSIAGDTHKTLAVRGLIPATLERFPWGGHLGLAQLDGVLEYLEQGDTALLFTNTERKSVGYG